MRETVLRVPFVAEKILPLCAALHDVNFDDPLREVRPMNSGVHSRPSPLEPL